MPEPSLNEVASRAASLFADTLEGAHVFATECRRTFELSTRDYRCFVSATDEILARMDRKVLRGVATSDVPMLAVRVSPSWDLSWGHEPSIDAAWTQGGDVAAQMADARLSFGEGFIAVIAHNDSRHLILTPRKFWLRTEPVARGEMTEGRFKAVSAWQHFVAMPAGLD